MQRFRSAPLLSPYGGAGGATFSSPRPSPRVLSSRASERAMRRLEADAAERAEAHAREAASLRGKCEELERQLLAMHTAAGGRSFAGALASGAAGAWMVSRRVAWASRRHGTRRSGYMKAFEQRRTQSGPTEV